MICKYFANSILTCIQLNTIKKKTKILIVQIEEGYENGIS